LKVVHPICAGIDIHKKSSKTQADKIRIALDNFLGLNEKIAKIEALIDEKARPYQHIIDLICTVPGIKKTAAVAIIAEIGTRWALTNLFRWARPLLTIYSTLTRKGRDNEQVRRNKAEQ